MRWNDSCPAFLMKDFNVVNQARIAIFDLSFTKRYLSPPPPQNVKPKVRDSSVFTHLWSMYVYQCCLSGVMSDEKKTSRHGYFVSIHNCLYTQCIGAPIKKTSFFSSFFFVQTFFPTFFKKPQIFFLHFYRKQRKLCTWTSNNRIPHRELQSINRLAAQSISSLKQKNKNNNNNKH